MRKIVDWFIGAAITFAVFSGCGSDSSVTSTPPVDPMPPDSSQTDTAQVLSDEELMTVVQKTTFKYFWDNAELNSGLALERSNGSSTTVTMGGSGFGLAAFPVAVERGWITRDEAVNRLQKILTFLEKVPTYHGAFSHWYNGSTANMQPFSEFDDGGDLVETAFLMEGLLIIRKYFNMDTDAEKNIRNRITALWEAVDWTWYTQGQNVLYWHWSPNYDFKIGLKIKGYDEALMVYVLAASSPTHAIKPAVYNEGWAQNGAIKNGKTFYDTTLPLGTNKGGPLFFEHYSFIGLNPNGLTDKYANYEDQTKAHSLINYYYCKENPLGYKGYGGDAWGLTASDDPDGYAVHSPSHNTGVITPTAAISSIPYTPEKSLAAMHYFYEQLGDRLWGKYGFYDAYKLQLNNNGKTWFADSYLAIDQGPIITMIENYRTGLLWDLFMHDSDVKNGLQRLGFSSGNM